MPAGYERNEKFARVARLLQLLQTTRLGMTTRDLADELEVEPRSVQRYMTVLRDRAGLDIEYEGNRWRMGDSARWRSVPLDHHQATAFLIALRMLHRIRPEQDPALVGALSSLAAALQVPVVSRYLEATLRAAEQRHKNTARRSVERAIVDGFVQSRAVAIEYESIEGNVTKRDVHPYFLEPRPEGRGIYVFAYEPAKKRVTTFRLERIRAARVLPTTFTVPDTFDVDAFLGGAWGIWSGDETNPVVLRFAPAVAARVRENAWHPSAELEPQRGGGLLMRVRVTSDVEMRPWVLGWGAQVEVLEPESLRTYVAGVMRDGAALYAGSPARRRRA